MTDELDDITLDLDEEGNGQLYEHLRMEVDRGQEPVRMLRTGPLCFCRSWNV